jgi:hypothetical protein
MHGAVRKAEVFLPAGRMAGLAVAILLGVCACGSADHPAVTTTGSSAKAHKHKNATGQPGDQGLADMVSAVGASKAGPPVEVKYALPSRPEVGQVMEVDVAVIPRNPVPDDVSVAFQVVDGLDIVEGAQLERTDKLVDGTPIRHVVKILPKRDGIFALTAIVSFTAANQDSTRTFSIPVIAGEGLPDQVAKGP